jgi:hypothetical protein
MPKGKVMPNQRIILNFRQYDDKWSEVYYGAFEGIQAAIAAIDATFQIRAVEFRQESVLLTSVKAQDVYQPRVATIKRFQPPAAPSSISTPDVHNVAAVCFLATSGLDAQRHIWLRGIRDVDTLRDGTTGGDKPSAALLQGIRTYISNMNRVGLLIRALMPITKTDPYNFYDIESMIVRDNSKVTLTTKGTVPLTASSRVILSQFDKKKFPGLNGHWTAKSVAPPNFDVNYVSEDPPGTIPVSKGRYRVEEYRYLPIDLMQPDGKSDFLGLSTRVTRGGPFGGRGRKRAVSLRSQ